MTTEFPEGPLTILFTDVEGSTDLRTRRGDVAAQEVLREHERLVRSCVGEHGRKSPASAVRVRIGLNTGEVVDDGGDLYG